MIASKPGYFQATRMKTVSQCAPEHTQRLPRATGGVEKSQEVPAKIPKHGITFGKSAPPSRDTTGLIRLLTTDCGSDTLATA